MKIQILIRRNGVDDHEITGLMAQAGQWFAEELLTPSQVSWLGMIKIALRHRRVIGGDVGQCRPIWTGLDNPRDFRLTVARDLDLYWKVRTLAHEFVHVKQRVNRELTYRWVQVGDYPEQHAFWKGRDVHGMPYVELPYEVEAEAMEEGLANRFLIEKHGWRYKKNAG